MSFPVGILNATSTHEHHDNIRALSQYFTMFDYLFACPPEMLSSIFHARQPNILILFTVDEERR